MDIWSECNASAQVEPITGKMHRLVESQEQIATAGLVDNMEEQGLLEDLLETTKPANHHTARHYLISTPFRYPPLRHGSRFGGRFEPSLFYGSLTLPTALAETAYYRFVFLSGLDMPFKKPILSEHTAFTVKINTQKGLKLQTDAFSCCKELLTSPQNYADTQQLGSTMRKNGIEAFQFLSARDADAGINLAAFSPESIVSRQPDNVSEWLCHATPSVIGFSSVRERQNRFYFDISTFLVDGILPVPAV